MTLISNMTQNVVDRFYFYLYTLNDLALMNIHSDSDVGTIDLESTSHIRI